MKKTLLFTRHWKDLQIKLFYILGSYSLTFLICLKYRINLFYFISSYFILLKKTFIFTHLSSGFWSTLQLIFWASTLLISPLILYFCFLFFLKSLFKFQIQIILGASALLGVVTFNLMKFAFLKLLPLILNFFVNFENHTGPLLITLEARLDQYLNFFFNFTLLIALLLLIPVLLLIFLTITNSFYEKNTLRQYLYTAALLLFLTLSPPDLLFQLLFFSIFALIVELLLFFFQVFVFFLENINVS